MISFKDHICLRTEISCTFFDNSCKDQNARSQRPFNRFWWAAARLTVKQARGTRFWTLEVETTTSGEGFRDKPRWWALKPGLAEYLEISFQGRDKPYLNWKISSKYRNASENNKNVSAKFVLVGGVLRGTKNGWMVAEIQHFEIRNEC